MKTIEASVGFALIAAMLPTPVYGHRPSRQGDSSVSSEQVIFADLNLGQAAGRSMLQQRIRAAADRVCDLGGMRTLEEFSTSSNCYHRAVADGYHQMDQLIAQTHSGTVLAASISVTAGN